jgi:hypothetical protein
MCIRKGMAPAVRLTPRDPAHSKDATVDTQSIRTPTPEVLPDDETPHGCYDGFVYIGHIVEDGSGEPVEVIERVPCRRCAVPSGPGLSG